MKAALTKLAGEWSIFLAWIRLGIALLFLPIMVFLFVVSPKTRLFTAVATALLAYFLVRIARAVMASSASHSQSEIPNHAGNALGESNFGTASLRRVHLGIVSGQLLGAAGTWLVWRSPQLLTLVVGAATFSIVGLALGVWWDRRQFSAWVQLTARVRWFYVIGAIIMTLVGGVLMLMLCFVRQR